MKILVVSNMYPTSANPVGGIFVHEQVKALRRAGMDARVVSGRPLWLSGRRPRHALGTVRAELRSRQKPFVWTEYDGVPTASFNYFAGALARPWVYPLIYRHGLLALIPDLVRGFPYDIVHTHTAFLDGRAGAAAAAFRSVPMVLTEHTGPFSLVTDDWRFRQHTLAGMKKAQRVIAVSGALKVEIMRRLPSVGAKQIQVVPNGVDIHFFDPDFVSGDGKNPVQSDWENLLLAAKRELVLSNFIVGLRHAMLEFGDKPVSGNELARVIETATLTGIGEGPYREELQAAGLFAKPVIQTDDQGKDLGEQVKALWVGHLVDVKRVDRLLEAFAIASRRRPALRLRLVGGGELETPLRQRASALDLDRALTFVPSRSRDGIRREMAAADFLVISSETETFGVVGVEAMAMGLPVLATDCGGPADYVTAPAYGELVGNTTEDLAIGLQRMVDRLAGFDKAAIRCHAAEHFDFDLVAGRLSDIYTELTQGEPSGSTMRQQVEMA